jgi:trigger factor
MKVTIENKKGLNKDLKVFIDKKTMVSYMDKKYEEIKGTVNLKGFRPGKVPKEILKRQFGQAVFSEVLDKVIKDTSTRALEENKIKPAGQPKLDLKTYGQDKDLEYIISVTELPKVEVSFITLSRTSLNTACPNCLFSISFGTFPGLNPFRFTVPLISSYFLSI